MELGPVPQRRQLLCGAAPGHPIQQRGVLRGGVAQGELEEVLAGQRVDRLREDVMHQVQQGEPVVIPGVLCILHKVLAQGVARGQVWWCGGG